MLFGFIHAHSLFLIVWSIGNIGCDAFSSISYCRNHDCLIVLGRSKGVGIGASIDSFQENWSAGVRNDVDENVKSNDNDNNILILDHLNINHQKGRHDWLKAFYIDFLQCAIDPRKMENFERGQKTVWANIGSQQFHLPEGKPDAQILDGVVTLVYPDLSVLTSDQMKLEQVRRSLDGSNFDITISEINDEEDGEKNSNKIIYVTDPWGSNFKLVEGDSKERDSRGRQPGDESLGLGMRDLTIHVPPGSNLAGIGRFYRDVLGSKIVSSPSSVGGAFEGGSSGQYEEGDESCIQIQVGPRQTLTFRTNSGTTVESHVDLRDEETDADEGEENNDRPHYMSNYGPHISMYVADLPTSYKKARDLGLAYVNPRFKRRAYTLEEAIDDCMFRCLDIVDPDNVNEGPILQLEHEVRSVVKKDGSMYKSCPFDEIPSVCRTM